MTYKKEIKEIENKLYKLSAELIALIPEDNDIISLKKDYYKNLMFALHIIKYQEDELLSKDIMRHCNK
jgi:hypothetical protein